jgi:hypothetical protein
LVQSLNVSIAAGLASFEYLRQRDFLPPTAESVAAVPNFVPPPESCPDRSIPA